METFIVLKYVRSECMPPLDMREACGWANLQPDKFYDNGIAFVAKIDGGRYVEREINALFDRIEPLKDDIARVMGIYSTKLLLAVYSNGEVNPGIRINHNVLRKLANWGGAVDIDLYCIDGDDE
jgi:hypothetical protein